MLHTKGSLLALLENWNSQKKLLQTNTLAYSTTELFTKQKNILHSENKLHCFSWLALKLYSLKDVTYDVVAM